MKAPCNRRVFVIGYAAATPLGIDFATTWERAVRGEAGFRMVSPLLGGQPEHDCR